MKFLALGKRLRVFREKKGFSRDQLSEKTGLSAPTIESYEADKEVPRIAELIKIAKALEINVADIFRERPSQKAFEIVRAADQVQVSPLLEPSKKPIKDYIYRSLTHPTGDKHLDAYLLEFPPGQGKKLKADLTHPGEEFLYILSGRLKILIEENEMEVEVGDSLFIRSSHPHALWNPFDSPAKVLHVIYPF